MDVAAAGVDVTQAQRPWHPTWMHDLLDKFGEKPMIQFILPASHDAGMNYHERGQRTPFGSPMLTMTQETTIKQQLEMGIRHFDIRPIMGTPGRFYCGHYTEIEPARKLVEVFDYLRDAPIVIPGYEAIRRIGDKLSQWISWQGGCSTSMEELILDVNDFLRDKNELVILDISGWGGFTDCVSERHRDLSQPEWEELYRQLSHIENLYKVGDGTDKEKLRDIKNLTLRQLIGSRGQCVIINNPRGEKYLGNRLLYQGFFPRASWLESYTENGETRYLDGGIYLSREPSTEQCVWAILRELNAAEYMEALINFWDQYVPGFFKPAAVTEFLQEMKNTHGFSSVIWQAKKYNEGLRNIRDTDRANDGRSHLRMIAADAVDSIDVCWRAIALMHIRFNISEQ